MKKRLLMFFLTTFIMLCLLSGGAALAATFGFNTEELEADNTISETNSGQTLQITSSAATDSVSNYTCQVGLGDWLSYQTNPSLIDNFVVYIGDLTDSVDGDGKPNGTITVSLSSGKAFILKSFACANESFEDTLTISDGTDSEDYSLPAGTNTLIEPLNKFVGITNFTISWANDNHMSFDNFVIELITNPIITSQPSAASVASGGNTSFSVAALGNTLSYQWQVDTAGLGDSFNNITDGGVYTGAASASLSIAGVTAGMNDYLFRCVVTNDGTYNTTSDGAALSILGQAPTDIALNNASIDENTAAGTKVGGLTTTDPDSSSFTYSLVDTGTYLDNASFTISGSDLLLNTVPNYENKASYSICIQTQDETGLSYTETFSITITDVNEAPADISLSSASIAENSVSGTTIGTLSGIDPDLPMDTLTYSLPEGMGDNACFSLAENILKLAVVPDFEEKSSYSITARVSDGTLHYDKTFTISITNINEAPTGIDISCSSALEHSYVGTAIGAFSGIDPDAASSFTYSLTAGTGDMDNDSFTIDINELKLGFIPDFETKDNYSIRVRVSDGSLTYDKQFTVTILDGNDPPTDIVITGGSIAEDAAPGTTVGSLEATDPNAGDTFTYSLVTGTGDTDNTCFSLSGSTLKLNTSLNYEVKNSYSVRIRTIDNHGFLYEKALTITVTNVNEAPTDMALSNNTIAEKSAIGATIGTLSGTDPDAVSSLTFSLPAGSGDNASFTISGTSLKLAIVPDFETKNTYSVFARVSDGGFTFDKIFTISITDADEAPTDIALSGSSVLEHCAVGTAIGLLTSDDQEGGAFTYSLVTGVGSTDNAGFNIAGNTLEAAVSLDFEMKGSLSVRIRTTDSTGLYYEKVFIIDVINGDDPPTNISLTSQSIAENSASGTTIGTLSSTDLSGPGPFTYTFAVGSGDTDNARFTISGHVLGLAVVPNYEAKSSYSIRIRTMNDVTGFYFEKAFTITITDVNEAPTGINLSSTTIDEHISSIVGAISGIDPDAGSTFTYELAAGVGDADNAKFTISGNELKLNGEADYEIRPTYNIRIRVTDNSSRTYEKDFIIVVINGNDPPTDIFAAGLIIDENTPAATVFAAMDCLDINGGSFTYSLVSGEGSSDNDKFAISANTLLLSTVPDYETKNSYNIRIRVTDTGGLYCEKAFTGWIRNVNEAPTDISLSGASVAENSAPGTTVGTLSGTDQDAGAHLTYILAAGAGDTDNSAFTISGDKLMLAAVPDYETKTSYQIRLGVSDGTLSYEKALAISIINVNEAPTGINLSGSSILEHSAVGTAIGTLSATDPDAGSTFTYTLVAGEGDTDNGSFNISSDSLQIAVSQDFEVKDSCSIRIRVTDSAGLYCEKVFTIDVTDGDDPPTDISITSQSIAENSASGTVIGTISSTDTDVSGTFTYSLVSGSDDADNDSFTIVGDELRLAVVLNFEIKNSYSIRIRTTDNTGFYYEKAFTISISNVNEAPKNIALSNNIISEDIPSGMAIGTFSGTDPDAGSAFTYSLVSGAGDIDNNSFMITGSTLKNAIVFNYETKRNYSIRVRITDEGGLWYDKQFTISVVKPAPVPVTSIAVSGTGGATSVMAGKTLQMLADVSPADATNSSVIWSIKSGSGATISTSGLLSATAAGSVTVRATAKDGSGVFGERTITITAAPIAFVAVTGISGVPATATAGTQVTLTCTVAPANATNKTISWSIRDTGTTGATISGNKLSATVAGTVTVRATIANGLTVSTPYIQDFSITVSAAPDTDDGDDSNTPTTQPPVYKADVESGTGSDTTLPITVDKDNSNAGVEVGSGNVILSEGKTTVITVPSIPDVDNYTLGIPVPDLSTSVVQGALSFNTGAGSVTVPSDMLTGVTGISGARAEIEIGQGDKARLPRAVKAAIGDKPLIQLTLSIDGKQTNWNNPDAPVTVSIPYKPTAAELAHPESIVIWYIDGSGRVVSIPSGHYDPATGMVTFSTTHFSDYAVAYNPVSYNDVLANAWYSKAVCFIAARGITSGTGNGKYSPESKLTRGEFIVMMMRAYGIAPDENPSDNPSDNFSDAGSTYYTGYLAAAKRLGISEGVGNNMYAPGNRITRQETFTLLYNTLKVIGRLPRMHGRAVSEADDQPQGDPSKTLSDFSDAGEINAWAREAMTTFVVTGTVGGNSGKLTPTSTTTRAEMAQVLYNLLGK